MADGRWDWTRKPRVGIGLIIAATVLTVITGFLGPSVVTLTLGPRINWLPPWYLPSDVIGVPHEWLVVGMVMAAIVVGAIGLVVCLRALAAGWKPSLRKLFALGLGLNVATICVPPMTSVDVLMYAGYGRLQLLGRSPYETTPAEIFRSQYDPLLRWTEEPWVDTPSVYGPIITFIQYFANVLGGDNMHNVVFWLQVSTILPFIACCFAVIWLAHGDAARQARSILLTLANPIMIWAVVAGAHNEAWAIMFAILGILGMRRSSFAAGLMIGLAGCCKLSIGLYGLAMLWGYRHRPADVVKLLVGTAIPMGIAYLLIAPDALFQVVRNLGYVSAGSWAIPLWGTLDHFMPRGAVQLTMNILTVVMLVVVAWMLSRVLPWKPIPGLSRDGDPRRDPITIALRTAMVLSVAWLTTSLYTLTWYDLMVWAPLALLGATHLDWIFVVRGVLLSLSYVPGRMVDQSEALQQTQSVISRIVSPVVQMAVLGVIVWWYVTWRRKEVTQDADREAGVVSGSQRSQ